MVSGRLFDSVLDDCCERCRRTEVRLKTVIRMELGEGLEIVDGVTLLARFEERIES